VLKKSRGRFKKADMNPDDEMDEIPAISTKLFAYASIVEGIAFALYASLTAGVLENDTDHGIYYSQNAIVQALRFTSIILLCFHRIMRPANRADPLRTVLELEVVSVCWDAIDGSTFFELIGEQDIKISTSADHAARFLMAIWYLSVGLRLAMMFLVHLAPNESLLPKSILKQPLAVSPSPTVDRTLQALRVRATIILVMAVSELFALGLRIGIWVTVGLSSVQIEMVIKNILFLSSVANAYLMWSNTELREWNRADFFGLKYPSRRTQLEIYRCAFIISYCLLGAMFSSLLIDVTSESTQWVANVGSDIFLCAIFFYYYKFAHVKKVRQIFLDCDLFLIF
jgi:hypothetical protein